MLHIDYFALPFSLFLYHTSMDGSIEPDVYVMTRAWYGVVPTGAQAAVAIRIRLLAELSSSDYPDAIDVLSKDIYVDDVGFKYVVYSGRKPGEKASPDGIHVKLL